MCICVQIGQPTSWTGGWIRAYSVCLAQPGQYQCQSYYIISTTLIGSVTYVCTNNSPSLCTYNAHRATGVTFGNQDFQASIKGRVSKGETFKAYPTCFGHTDQLAITTALKLTAAVKDIALSKSEQQTHSGNAIDYGVSAGTRLGVRVKIVPYPEGTCACWVMICAVRS